MYLIVGAGLSGSVIAERVANKLGKKVKIIDRRDHIAGNVYDYIDTNGIMVHAYGPHAFHTNSKKVWDYLSQFTKWQPYFHKVQAFVDGQDIPLPFNFTAIEKLFPKDFAKQLIKELIEEFGINRKITILELLKNDKFQWLAQYVYEKIFLGYTVKQWGKKPQELDISVSGRVPIYTSKDDRYFQDRYQAIPKDGYTKMVEKMIDSSLIEVELNRDFKEIDKNSFEKIVYTGMIDEYFDYQLGKLPYRSLYFDLVVFEKEYYQKTAQKNYPENFDFTRVTEFKYFLDQKTKNTVVAFEYPKEYENGKNEPYYPIPEDKNHNLYKKYEKLAKNEKNVIFLGRLAEYRYYNMDQVVLNALNIFENMRQRE